MLDNTQFTGDIQDLIPGAWPVQKQDSITGAEGRLNVALPMT